ncbi:MAG: glycosyltransferase family 4 protein, partial [Acidobacteriota bacterium]|nr:glycosyltransferase family 4 protein [Acidobacteriota bacterium]
LAGLALRRLRADIIANCQFTSSQWAPFLPAHRREVIYNGVEEFRYARHRSFCTPRIGCIGRIGREKGQREFVEAARLIHRALPACRFEVIGAPLFDDRAAVAYDAGMRGAAKGLPIDFTGWQNDVYAVLSRLDLLLVPSASNEATTRVIPEAWAAYVPVIAFPSGGVREIVRHGENGFLAATVAEMADFAVRSLTGDRSETARIAAAGHTAWQGGFTLEHFAERLLASLTRSASAASTTIGRPNRQDAA